MTEDYNFSETSTGQSRQTAWLSRGLESLVDERPWMSDPTSKHIYDFDVVIVGSGYGGAVAAAELSGSRDEFGRPIDVCVLERGREYLPGAFPSRQADLAGYVRFMTPDASRQRGVHDGLYDIRLSEDAVAVVASGLGGGSLINAGVMEMPIPQVFREARWPRAIRNDVRRLYRLAHQMRPRLGASRLPSAITGTLKKTSQLGRLAQGRKVRPTRITIAPAQGANRAGVMLNECLLCGDCATGCNNGAKDSLDLNLLVVAQRAGAQVITGATVLRLTAHPLSGAGWVLHVNHTDNHLRDRQPTPFQIRARRVILAAGTLGSTEILLRSRDSLRFSAQLGQKFSANGDMLVTAYGLSAEVNAVAHETIPPRSGSPPPAGARQIGPTITSMIDLRTGNPKSDLVIQDLAVPGPLRRLFEEVTTTFDVLNQLGEGDFGRHQSEPATDDAAINPEAVKKSLVLAMIGRDDASGELSIGERPICDNADGLLTVRWPELRMDRRFDDHHWRLTEMMRKAGVGGRVVNNPLWRPFSENLERLFGRKRGPLVTVHPLGGCAMGDNVRQGVTDHCGRVFDAGGPGDKSVHEGLVVLDGSIVPTSLGINPALTIAVLAFRALTQLMEEWKLTTGQPTGVAAKARPGPRTVFATPTTITDPKPTLIQLTEQVRGRVKLRAKDGRRVPCELQLTLTTQPTAVKDLIAYNAPELRGFEIASGKGNLTILRTGEDFDSVSDMAGTDSVALEALVSGNLRLFALEPSNPYLRTARALSAWIINRGLRDTVQTILQSVQERLHLRPRTDRPKVRYRWYHRAWNFTTGIISVCSRAGAVRLIEYDLKIDKVLSTSDFDALHFDRASIRAVKRLTYGRAASPFTQLLGMSLKTFPQMRSPLPLVGKFPVLQLNKRYLAQQQIPLLRVVDQQDGVAGLIDCLALALYLFRVTVQRHALSFRRPDAPSARTPQRLPGRLPDLPEPEIDWLTVDGKATPPVRIRLTRYNGTGRNKAKIGVTRPVLLIHGYSASGTTFAHPAVPGNLAQTLCEAGRDVWVLDLRCSAGLPTGTGDWPFEVMAEDIPLAVDHVAQHERTQDGSVPRVDIVAHCMGAAMFSMAVLGDGPRQKRLHEKIGRVVFSQVGPVMMLSRTNVLAAYIMRYARHFLSFKDYTFSPQGEVSVAGQLLDRALAAMSMPYHEYKRENPLWLPGKATPWAGTRNRMDALYGRTFSLKNISNAVLDRIDDFFGPVSIETVSQVIHFAASNTVTDQRGINRYATPSRLAQRFDFPLMSIHGEDNGLADVATLALMCNILERAGIRHLNAGSDAAPASLKSLLLDIAYSFSRMLKIFGIRWRADRLGIVRSQREITRLIDSNHADLIPGRPSYLTWRIKGHGHQDCLIGKHAPTICGAIARYLAAPDQTTAVPRQAAPISKRKRSSCQAIAPAFGVRARILKRAAKIRLQACDSSGRGPPLRAMIVPVRQVGTRFALDGKGGAAVVPHSYKLLSSAGVCICKPIKMRKRKRESNWPWFFEIPYKSWPSHASAVLVLLLYNQAEGIGGNSRPPRPMLNNCDQVKSPIAKAICEALSYDSIDTLRGGLISGSLIDQRPKERITFALASCLYPSDILNHMPAAENATVGPADASLLTLSNLLGKPEAPTLLLLAGDQMYADATAGLFDPKVQDERYRIPHERRGESRGSKAVVQRLDLDVQMMLDDHEIQDNWAPNDPEPTREDLKRAKLAYFLYERASPKTYADIWHKLNHRGLPFFLADARTEREARTANNWRTAKIMKPTQFRELCRWLVAPKYKETPKFVMTASALLPRRLTMNQPACALGADAWDGYPLSRYSLLKVICDNEIKGVVFLSGDEHLSSITTVRVSCDNTGKKCALHSVHSSGLFSPYPVANGSPADFIAKDAFGFSFPSQNGKPREYQCLVETQFFPGDGFALLSAHKNSAGWCLDVKFHNEARLKPNGAATLSLIQ